MPLVRSKGHDVVIRHAGRRLRLTTDWSEVSEEALEHLRTEAGDQIEEQVGEATATASASAPAPDPEPEPETEKPKAESRPKAKKKDADTKSDDRKE